MNFVMRVDSSISYLIVCQRTIHKLVIGLAVVGLSIAWRQAYFCRDMMLDVTFCIRFFCRVRMGLTKS